MTDEMQKLSDQEMRDGMEKLKQFLSKIPGVQYLDNGKKQEWFWYVKFDIDIEHPLAWQIVQELGFVLNYISLTERFPTIFKPVSPPPYLNGGPKECLSWVIESTLPYVNPNDVADALQERLPQPVENVECWLECNAE